MQQVIPSGLKVFSLIGIGSSLYAQGRRTLSSVQTLLHFVITLALTIRLLNRTYKTVKILSLLEVILEEVNIIRLEDTNRQWKLQWNLTP